MEYEDYLIREASEGPPADWSDSPVEWCNECERALELCVCEKDTAYNDRQELIHNLSAGETNVVSLSVGADSARCATPSIGVAPNEGGRQGAQALPDTWEAIAAQLDYWADMDRDYWRQRREKSYAAWFDRTYGV